jgi:signal transduction histidine kinase
MNDFLIKIIILFITLVSITITISYTSYKIIQRKQQLLKINKERAFKEIQNERLRISAEIHDISSSSTLRMKNILENSNNVEDVNFILNNLIESINTLNHEISFATEKIFPRGLIFQNWNSAVKELCDFLARFTHIDCIMDNQIVLNEFTAHESYRILQEHLTNIIKHVNPKYIQIIVYEIKQIAHVEIIYPNQLKITDSNKKPNLKFANSGKGLYFLSLRYKAINAKTSYSKKDLIITETIKFPIV